MNYLHKILTASLIFFFLASFTSCKTVDVRTDYALQNTGETDEQKGRRLLDESYLAMGYDRLEDVEAYSVKSNFDWRMPWSMMPMNALPGNKNKDILFRFTPNTFDGQVSFLEGRKEGKTYGLQSWQGYMFKDVKDVKLKNSARYDWGLPTYHYLIEAPMRLRSAEIIRYAGNTTFNEVAYDLIYVTWGEDAPHKEHDQWLLYVNQETKMIDLTELTINDFFLPMPAGMKGASVQFERNKAANGSWLPTTTTIQLGKPKALRKHVYTIKMWDYQFDTFSPSVLYPLPGLEKVGDRKAIK